MPITLFEKVIIHIDTRRTQRDPLPKELEALKNAPPNKLKLMTKANMQSQTVVKKSISKGRRRNG